ncbi:MAG: glycosyltransferase [Actinomycetota bacterium]
MTSNRWATNRRITVLLPNFNGGGAERMALRLAAGFLDREHSVDVAVFKATGVLIGQLDPRARLVDLRGRRGVTAVPALATHIVRSRPDVVLSFMTAANGVAGLCEPIVRHLHRPVFVGSQRGWSSPVFGDMRTTLKGEIAYRAYRRGYRHLDGMVGVRGGIATGTCVEAVVTRSGVHTV